MKATTISLFFVCLFLFNSCSEKGGQDSFLSQLRQDSLLMKNVQKMQRIKAKDIIIEKDFLYDKYTLQDTYPYRDTTRQFQWEKIKQGLAILENFQQEFFAWGILQNYRNNNGEAPLVKKYKRNEYKRIADTLGVERFQGIPLFLATDTVTGNASRVICSSGEKSKNVFPCRWHNRNRRLCSLCQPLYKRRIYTRYSRECTKYYLHRIQPFARHDTPFAYVCA